jgi:hypothetical protein
MMLKAFFFTVSVLSSGVLPQISMRLTGEMMILKVWGFRRGNRGLVESVW